jgi:hypothetical protein
MKNPFSRLRQATLAGVVVLIALTVWTMLSADDVSGTLVSVTFVGIPVLAIVLGVVWLVGRSGSKQKS